MTKMLSKLIFLFMTNLMQSIGGLGSESTSEQFCKTKEFNQVFSLEHNIYFVDTNDNVFQFAISHTRWNYIEPNAYKNVKRADNLGRILFGRSSQYNYCTV